MGESEWRQLRQENREENRSKKTDSGRGREWEDEEVMGWFSPSCFFFFFLVFSKAAPMAYGGSQARGLIGPVAAGLHHSHRNMGSEMSL